MQPTDPKTHKKMLVEEDDTLQFIIILLLIIIAWNVKTGFERIEKLLLEQKNESDNN